VKALSGAELSALIEATPERWRLLVRFVAATGLRIGEVVALRWEHMDLDRSRVLVRERRYRETVDAPKSRYGRRDVPLGRGLAAELRRHRLASPHPRETDPVFATLRGTPHRPENLLRRVLKPAAERAGVGWAGWHTLRHTCATSLFRTGANAKQVQVWLGHHSPAFTLATYVHLLADDLPDGEVMDGIVGLG
jgi:integrase